MSDQPSLMQALKESMAQRPAGSAAAVAIDPKNPNHGTITFTDSKGSISADLTTKGHTVSLQFHEEMNPQRVKDFHGRINEALGGKPLSVNSPDVKHGAQGHAMTIRADAEAVTKLQENVVTRRAQVAQTVQIAVQEANMHALGIDRSIVDAQTKHALAAAQNPHDVLAHRSPMQAEVRAGMAEFERLMAANTTGAKPTVPVQPATHPYLAELLNKNVTLPDMPAAAPAHGMQQAARIGVQAGKANVEMMAVVAVVTTAAVAGTALYRGASVGDAASAAASAAANTLPVITPLRAGRNAEAVAQVVSGALVIAAGATAPMSAGGSFVVAAGIDDALRHGAKKLGMDVDDGQLTHMVKAAAAAVQRNPVPAGAIRTNSEFVRQQENMLKDAGLMPARADGKPTAADYLRDPDTRGAYLGSLKESLGKQTSGAGREQVTHMIEASEKFIELEGRRVAKLAPHLEKLSAEIAGQMKVQQLASQFQKSNSVPAVQLADEGAMAKLGVGSAGPSRGGAAGRG